MATWRLIKAPGLSGRSHMDTDLQWYTAVEEEEKSSVLRIYSWQPPCVSLGYAQDIKALVDQEKAKLLGWEIVRRPTGGGMVFHNEAEVAYSVITAIDNPLLPAGLIPAYKKLSAAVVRALQKLGLPAEISNVKRTKKNDDSRAEHLCFAFPAEYEITVKGKKIVGSAQKRGKRTLLQQGSIFVRKTPPSALTLLKVPPADIESASLEEILGRSVGFEELSTALTQGFGEELGVVF